MIFQWKQRGPEVRALQEALIAKGYKLDRFGADSELGAETWKKIEVFAKVDQFSTLEPLPEVVTNAILSAPGTFAYPPGYVRVKGDPADVHGMRAWSAVTAIMLHQTGIWMNDTPERFRTLDAHIGILDKHETPIVQVQELNAYIYHGNETNRFTVGFEINGLFPGLIKDFDPKIHTAAGPTERQIKSTCLGIKWVCEEVAAHGGRVTHIIPHRCSNDTRRSDPGEAAWKSIGLWAIDNLKLADYGPGWSIGDGSPIPGEWCPRPGYEKYKF